jgi:RNA-binding protein YhbY
MGGHRGSEGVQRTGCQALRRLADNKDNVVKIGAEGGVEAIVQAMGGHRGSEGVQRTGCEALRRLADNKDNVVKIGAEGGVEAIVQAMGAHRGSACRSALRAVGARARAQLRR